MNSISKRTRNQNQQATSSVLKKPPRYNEGQQHNDVTSSTLSDEFLIQLNETEIANDSINNTAFENEDILFSTSLSDYERDIDLVPLPASSSYKNDNTIRPSSSVRRNDSATPLLISSSNRGDDMGALQ
ncbi:hypothetical protein C2G38_2208600 [Gigaspora rosea]|uniref:Uncharacterized protein n=1 Tax=Gigaspora rosea TaxID=44941 RepID=A0A397UH12_9GLOM|nr:hypothetical protein C2G38_2208600 [Gigaspora rosea]